MSHGAGWWRAPPLRDGALACALLAFGVVVSTSAALDNGTVVDTLLLPLVVAPLFARRRAPLAAAGALAVGIVVTALPTLATYRCGVAVPVALVVLFALALRAPLDRALVGLAAVLGAMVVLGFTEALFDDGLGFASFSLPICGGVWAAGRLMRSREELSRALAERSTTLERRREQTAALAVEVERTRLASELDGAARERVRRIVALADDGDRLLARGAGGAPQLFARIEREGREALNELRGLLGVLRTDERQDRLPRPTLAQLEALLADARAGGRLVDLEVSGERRPLPSGVELAAYRTVQHALAAVRGPAGEPVAVRLRYLAAALELEVCGRPAEGTGADVAVLAARERVRAHGGWFSASSTGAGARVLRAHLPLGATRG